MINSETIPSLYSAQLRSFFQVGQLFENCNILRVKIVCFFSSKSHKKNFILRKNATASLLTGWNQNRLIFCVRTRRKGEIRYPVIVTPTNGGHISDI